MGSRTLRKEAVRDQSLTPSATSWHSFDDAAITTPSAYANFKLLPLQILPSLFSLQLNLNLPSTMCVLCPLPCVL